MTVAMSPGEAATRRPGRCPVRALAWLALLLAGCVLETTAALILFVPVFLPLLPHLGITEVHFGAIIILNLAIGMLTPPVGVCLFVSCAIGKVGLPAVSRAVLPFLLVLILDLLLVCAIPALTDLSFLP